MVLTCPYHENIGWALRGAVKHSLEEIGFHDIVSTLAPAVQGQRSTCFNVYAPDGGLLELDYDDVDGAGCWWAVLHNRTGCTEEAIWGTRDLVLSICALLGLPAPSAGRIESLLRQGLVDDDAANEAADGGMSGLFRCALAVSRARNVGLGGESMTFEQIFAHVQAAAGDGAMQGTNPSGEPSAEWHHKTEVRCYALKISKEAGADRWRWSIVPDGYSNLASGSFEDLHGLVWALESMRRFIADLPRLEEQWASTWSINFRDA